FKGEKIGVITAQSYRKNKYGDKNVFILKILANYIAIATHNAHKFESAEEQVDIKTREIIMQKIQLQKTNYHQRIINLIGQKISTESDLDDIFIDMYDKISQLMDTTIFGIRIYHQDKQVIEYNYEIESGLRTKYGFISIKDGNNYSNWCLNNSSSIFINDNSIEYKKYVSEIQVSYGEISESLLFQPLILNDEKLGVITVQSYNKNAYNRAHLDMLGNLANYTCLAIKNQFKKQETIGDAIG
ncbi:MAG: GAF domain-containing protein, partial [Crocinitomicaceae bacterium]|nr:GAF domain-containing protein [Crocinitomicaceae bacterium]